MQKLRMESRFPAPPNVCFDLARSIDLELASVWFPLQAVGGVTIGLIGAGEMVRWRTRQFGVTWHHTSRITEFDPPQHFRDEMERGAFRSFRHDHFFAAEAEDTVMTDVLTFAAPFAFFSERWLLRPLLEKTLIAKREQMMRVICGEAFDAPRG